tara:strand:+ start:5703 stop:8084 length:2382 start_codon:yes stop_codon:yes gene_type:complete
MDFNQCKLTKTEWNSIEIPLSEKDKYINNLIIGGFNNVNISLNKSISLISFLKITSTEILDDYVYCKYLQADITNIAKQYGIDYLTTIKNSDITIKKADAIRFNNTDKQLAQQKNDIIEFVIIRLISKLYKHHSKKEKKWVFYYYTLSKMITFNFLGFNNNLKKNTTIILEHLRSDIDYTEVIRRGTEIIENNTYLFQYSDDKLYDHQKELFTYCKDPKPKLIQYIAPTGTGKTLSPLGLSEHCRVIFVCAARHVGLSLAKAAISAHKKVAFAFGCSDAEDIRLHYYAAKDYTKNRRTGGIGKVDNTVGNKVEIMITDIKSYLPAMYYMLAFNKKEDIIMYWDEPTITMDYDEHEFHSIIHKNWTDNLIENVVLSSATLPQFEDMQETIGDFRSRFEDAQVHTIVSHDCNKSIPIINKAGYVEMPHFMSKDYEDIQRIVSHCSKYKTLLRYIDFEEAISFIMKANEMEVYNSSSYSLLRNFHDINDITMSNIKLYYLKLLGNIIPDKWESLSSSLEKKMYHKSTIHMVTGDAHTLTNGPTIFLTEDVNKIARFCLQEANIPDAITRNILEVIKFNNNIKSKINVLQKLYEDGTKDDENKEKKMADGRVSSEMHRLTQNIKELEQCIKSVELEKQYIPNSETHLRKYRATIDGTQIPFTCDITEEVIENIMLIDDVEDIWKILLMMGIGAFMLHNSDSYIEIMKNLAQEQKLYMIIASSDYIYGTNYQFCNGYISKDMGLMSQEKCIQAMGRIGRNKLQHKYSIRFRDDGLIYKLFNEEKDKPEVANMARLFNS